MGVSRRWKDAPPAPRGVQKTLGVIVIHCNRESGLVVFGVFPTVVIVDSTFIAKVSLVGGALAWGF